MTTAPLKHVLVDAQEGPAQAWILVCHGLGDSHQGWLGVVPCLNLPQCSYAVVDAPLPYYDGWSWFRIPGLTGPLDGPEDFRRDLSSSLEKLAAFIDYLEETQGLSPEQLFLMGFSQGCQMVVAHALRSQRAYRGIIGISGFFGDLDDYPDACGTAFLQQDFLITHGRYDSLLPLENNRQQCQSLQEKLAIRLDWRAYDKEHSLDPQQEIPDIRAWISARLNPCDQGGQAHNPRP